MRKWTVEYHPPTTHGETHYDGWLHFLVEDGDKATEACFTMTGDLKSSAAVIQRALNRIEHYLKYGATVTPGYEYYETPV